jgi:hypothetical protein
MRRGEQPRGRGGCQLRFWGCTGGTRFPGESVDGFQPHYCGVCGGGICHYGDCPVGSSGGLVRKSLSKNEHEKGAAMSSALVVKKGLSNGREMSLFAVLFLLGLAAPHFFTPSFNEVVVFCLVCLRV